MDQPNQPETRRQRRERERRERRDTAARGASRRSFMRWLVPVVVLLLIVGGATWWFATRPTPTAAEQAAKTAQATRSLALSCTTDAAVTYHVHAHLTITVDGQDQPVPAEVGISPICQHPLHTHDASQVIHIESPKQRDFTLGDFFAVWGKDFTATKVLDTTVDAQHQLQLFVNGTAVTTGADTVMHAHDSFAIIVSPIGQTVTPPANYSFPSGE